MNFTAAGRLRHIITIEELTGKTQSANSGEITGIWTPIEEVYAEVKPLRGRNVELATIRAKGRVLSHQITMRCIEGIDLNPATYRFDFCGRKLEIFQVIDVLELGIEWDILANEIVS